MQPQISSKTCTTARKTGCCQSDMFRNRREIDEPEILILAWNALINRTAGRHLEGAVCDADKTNMSNRAMLIEKNNIEINAWHLLSIEKPAPRTRSLSLCTENSH